MAADLAAECGGHYLDQFTYAERATDWRGNNNIAESIFTQLRREPHPVPAWIVVGAGTGGTSATIGRYLRLHAYPTRLCVVDPENSAFFPGWRNADPTATGSGSAIEGIGRPRVEPSFVPAVVDRMISVPDAASVAAMRWCADQLDRHGRRFDRHQHVGRGPADQRTPGRGSARHGGVADLRRGAALRVYVLQRRVGVGSRLGSCAVSAATR